MCVVIAGATLCGCGGPPPLSPQQLQDQIKDEIKKRFAQLSSGDSWGNAVSACSYVSNVGHSNAFDQSIWVSECMLCSAKKCAESASSANGAASCFKKKQVKCLSGVAP